ncbi:MAG: hypothetical protein RJB32_648, partial [Actinomycetota bacterium]
EGKVALVPGSDHAPDNSYGEFVRFNIASSQARILEAVQRMARVLEG